eukprot:1158404-Pelagomonas_calceolata.AAC.1
MLKNANQVIASISVFDGICRKARRHVTGTQREPESAASFMNVFVGVSRDCSLSRRKMMRQGEERRSRPGSWRPGLGSCRPSRRPSSESKKSECNRMLVCRPESM